MNGELPRLYAVIPLALNGPPGFVRVMEDDVVLLFFMCRIHASSSLWTYALQLPHKHRADGHPLG
jgi:hypothetical protein